MPTPEEQKQAAEAAKQQRIETERTVSAAGNLSQSTAASATNLKAGASAAAQMTQELQGATKEEETQNSNLSQSVWLSKKMAEITEHHADLIYQANAGVGAMGKGLELVAAKEAFAAAAAENRTKYAEKSLAIAQKTAPFFDKMSQDLLEMVKKIPLFGGAIAEKMKKPLEDAKKWGVDAIADSLHKMGRGPLARVGKSFMGVAKSAGRGAISIITKLFPATVAWGAAITAATGGILLAVAAIGAVFALLVKKTMAYEKNVKMFQKELVVSRDVAQDFASQNLAIANNLKLAGISSEEVAASQLALAKAFKSSLPLSDELVKDNAMLAKSTGLSAENAADLQKAFKLTGKTGKKALEIIEDKGEGIEGNFKGIAKELAENVDLMYEFGADAIADAARQAKKMGIELKTMANVANKFLDPMEAITNANRLNLLFGSEINGLEMQRLANAGDLAGMTAYMTDELGLTADKLNDMGAAEVRALEQSSGLRKQDLLMALEKAKRDSMTEDQRLSAAKALASQMGVMETIIKTISLIWNTLLNPAVEWMSNKMSFIIEPMQDFIARMTEAKDPLEELKKLFSDVFEKNKPAIIAIGVVLAAVILPVLWGIVAALAAAVVSVVAATWPFVALGVAVYGIVKAVGFLKEKFGEFWDWVTGLFGGQSPSQLGLSILEGIVSVGTMIFDALTWPYRKAWEVISGLFDFGAMFAKVKDTVMSVFSGIGGLAGNVMGAVGGVLGGIFGGDEEEGPAPPPGGVVPGGAGGGGEARVLNISLNVDGKKFAEVMAEVML